MFRKAGSREAKGGPSRLRRAAVAGLSALALGLTVLPAQAELALPAAATLTYALKAKASGFNVEVDSTLQWRPDGDRYTLVNEGRFLFFSFIWASEGRILQTELQPELYREKRNKREKQTRFDAAGKRVLFNGGQQEAWQSGIQDRLSVLLSLSALGKAQPSQFQPGARFSMSVAGSSRSDNWHFTVKDRSVLDTELGQIPTVHLIRTRDDDDGQRIEVWLAPDYDWLPLRVLSREKDGDYLDQRIKSITHP